ncbi:MAG: PIG-L family deacetylase [Candidatus Limnocylindrales bacterium]
MPTSLTLLTVHAHPDDETISTGGVMARYAAEGLRVVCVTCTGGELGEIVLPELDTPANHDRLAAIRAEELATALATLSPEGRIEQRFLGYRDSGMMGTEGNRDPRAFWQAAPSEAVGRLVRIVREVRPDVIVGYNAFGGYGHPDHIRAGEVASGAFEMAGDPDAYPEQLRGPGAVEPWAARKWYETVLQFARVEALQAELTAQGIETPWGPRDDETDEERAEREGWLARMAEATGPVTTRVDVLAYLERKVAALQAHVTQIGPTHPFVALGAEAWGRYQRTEDFTLCASRVGVRLPEDDLFAGLR